MSRSGKRLCLPSSNEPYPNSFQVQLLATLAELMGSPCAELLWCQAAAAMILGLAGEFFYTSLLGL